MNSPSRQTVSKRIPRTVSQNLVGSSLGPGFLTNINSGTNFWGRSAGDLIFLVGEPVKTSSHEGVRPSNSPWSSVLLLAVLDLLRWLWGSAGTRSPASEALLLTSPPALGRGGSAVSRDLKDWLLDWKLDHHLQPAICQSPTVLKTVIF